MKKYIFLFLLTISLFLSVPRVSPQDSTPTVRKILVRVSPQYPDLARSMHLQGSVKAEVVVAPNGIAESIQIKGGHPLLGQAAQNALREWKWEPAPHQTHENVELKFTL